MQIKSGGVSNGNSPLRIRTFYLREMHAEGLPFAWKLRADCGEHTRI
ncbi:hypothetical protein KYC_20159 [Achromobacter arsenitoxydans SY8]|uniref:Uncharacterized protein n=1 Tax=Achromobacter arsenitoxydans SY8 TaxID=477184 RepID=H0FB75_9BURK|nr:hypothetical protein KYC_20159 [Achromobacter arsenitoxydans SY8]